MSQYDLDKSKIPSYDKNSKMSQYDIIYDDQVQQIRNGFYRSKFLNYKKTANDVIYTVENQYQYRLDLIANKFYGSAQYDWIIEDANNIQDPIKDVIAGKKLIIPDKMKLYTSF